MSQIVFKMELPFGKLTVFPQDDKIVLLAESDKDGLGYIYGLTRDQAQMLHTDLGAMLATFELNAE